jgi:hypothetical protein
MLKQIQIKESLKALDDPLVGLREEVDRRFKPSRKRWLPHLNPASCLSLW